jgi:hypothetical protein
MARFLSNTSFAIEIPYQLLDDLYIDITDWVWNKILGYGITWELL